MEKLKIAVGTASRYKRNAIEKVLHELDLDFEAKYSNVNSEVSGQPKEKGETLLGSINRAKNIFKKYSDSNFGIGVEFGYEPFEKSKYRMVCWASIIDSEGNVYGEQSSTLEMPRMYAKALEEGIEICDVFEELIDSLPKGNVSRRFYNFMLKDRVIYECVENVMLRYLLKDHFKE